jgi:two-component system sensor histidine kinase/response regulator
MKILFVDDTRDTRELFQMALKIQGIETRLAGDGLEAVEAVQQESFDAIIMDIEMPRMNGWDAVRTIRTLQNGQQVPIFMFTAYGNGENLKKALATGANDLWHKPILPTEILTRVQRYLA